MGVLIIRILLFRVLYWAPLFLETPIWLRVRRALHNEAVLVLDPMEAEALAQQGSVQQVPCRVWGPGCSVGFDGLCTWGLGFGAYRSAH